MLWAILRFELKFWLRGMMVWVFMLIIGVMIGGALSSDNIRVGGALENTYKNAPFVIQQFYAITGVLTLLMTTAFVNSAAARDFTYNTNQILFSTPLRRFDFLVGRYLGAVIVSVIPMLGVSLAALIVKYMPWVDAERWGPVRWDAHLMGVVVFAIPDTIFIAAVLFAIAALTRSTVATFLGGLFLLVGLAISDTLLSDLANERWAILLDPFGANAFSQLSKYWTVAEKNSVVMGLQGDLLLNRVLWMSVGMAIFGFAYARFSFAERSAKPRKGKVEKREAGEQQSSLSTMPGWNAAVAKTSRLAQFLGATRMEFMGLVKSTVFVVVMVAALLNTIPALILNAGEGYGNNTYPVTYWVLELIEGTLFLFLISIVTYFGGMLVWKERDARMDEIHDALPFPDWISYTSKLIALVGAVMIILAVAMASGVGVQAWKGYHRFQLDLYATEFAMDLTLFTLMSVMAFVFHVLAPNKYIGYFLFIAYLITNTFVWGALNVSTLMLRYGSRPSSVYSDLYGRAPYWEGWLWFTLYWLLFAGVLAVASIVFWRRGKEASWSERARVAKQRLQASMQPLAAAMVFGFLACGVWVFYNTKIVNTVQGPKDQERRRADYEKTYKKFEKERAPRVTAIRYDIDIFPATRNLVLRGEQTLVNKTGQPITTMYFTVDEGAYDHEIRIDGARQKSVDKRLRFWTYEFTQPMQPGETRMMSFTTRSKTEGFENSVSNPRLVQNGTFFDNSITPQIGYNAGGELSEPNDRKKYGLPPKDLMPALERNCTVNCGNTYLSSSSDWVSLETVISTSADQIAVAPGSLVKEWSKDGRRYFQYKFDRDSLNFYSFISAAYKVAREEADGVKVEVYYHPEHEWNVPKMLKSIRKSLEYCGKNFGPYAHKQARIIEFPRVARFAQAFPGTMPYSEGIGFIANLSNQDDIDMVYYVVAHEMAHQWWAHQVVGANMQGATLLSETMAQYTALMVMEHEYGRDMMRKFLKYEMDRYLRARGRELLKERPLLTVEASQGYIHYNKGSVAMYYLKEMIGEEAINQALRKLVQKFAYAGPPFPTSYDLVDALREVTPAEYQYVVRDLFEDITLFSNRTLSASAVKRADGKFDVKIEVESKKFKADAKGNEVETKVDDWVEIGAFAKPAKGKKYGATLYRERVRLTDSGRRTFQFVTSEYPEQAGIDPFALLVDRVPDDNLKKLSGS